MSVNYNHNGTNRINCYVRENLITLICLLGLDVRKFSTTKISMFTVYSSCTVHAYDERPEFPGLPPSLFEWESGIFYVHRGQKSYTPTAFGKLWTTLGVRCIIYMPHHNP